MRAGNHLLSRAMTSCCKDEEAFTNRLACNVVRIACLIQLNRKFIFVNSSLDFFKLLLVLIETYTCCRGGNGKCPVAIADLVLLHNKANDAQGKKDPISVDSFGYNNLKQVFGAMSKRIV